jgi:hypothetical protein
VKQTYEELLRLSRDLLASCDQLQVDAINAAQKENDYRRAKCIAYLSSEGTVQARQAMVDKTCERERLDAHMAQAIREAGMERVRSLRTIISAYQTYINSNTAEAEFAKTGPS